MDRDRAWVIPTLTGVLLLGSFYFSLGGVAGIVRDPGLSLAVLAIMIAIAVPFLWLSYRRQRRQPIIVPVSEAKSDVGVDEQLDHPPVVLLASRWKIFVRMAYVVVVGALFVGISLAQPGVCRVITIGLYGPVLAVSFVAWAFCLWRPSSLTFAPEGLSYRLFWGVRHWTWDEVREIRLVKSQVPIIGSFSKRRPTASVLFKRYQPKGQTGGSAQAGFLSIWKMNGEDLAALMEAARSKWSTPAGLLFVPVGGFFRTYYRTIGVMALIGCVVWMWLAQPCAA